MVAAKEVELALDKAAILAKDSRPEDVMHTLGVDIESDEMLGLLPNPENSIIYLLQTLTTKGPEGLVDVMRASVISGMLVGIILARTYEEVGGNPNLLWEEQ